MENIISLPTERLARRGFQHDGPAPLPPPHTHWRNTGAGAGSPASPGPDAYELIKTPHRLVRSQYCGIVWVKEEGPWRDLEICASPKVWGGGGYLLPAPPPWKVGGSAPLPPLFLRLYIWFPKRVFSRFWEICGPPSAVLEASGKLKNCT